MDYLRFNSMWITIPTFGYTARFGYVTPNDMLKRWQGEIHAERDRKLEQARQQRQLRRGKRMAQLESVWQRKRRLTRRFARPEPKE